MVYHQHQTVCKGARPNPMPLLQQVCVCVCMLGGAGVRRGRVETFFQNLVVAKLKRAVLGDQLVEVLVGQMHIVMAAGAVAVLP